jgi:hypothetical protein
MPSHPDRIHKQYEDLCSRCLKRPNCDWDNEATYPWLCSPCTWLRYLKDKVTDSIPPSILSMMSPDERP